MCEDKGDIGDWCDPTSLTNDYLHAPCLDGLSCYIAGSEHIGFKCAPSADGCYGRALLDVLSNADLGSRYLSENRDAQGIVERFIERRSDDAEELVDIIFSNESGNKRLLERISSVACGTQELVKSYIDSLVECRSNPGLEKDVKLGSTEEFDSPAFVLMLGGAADSSSGGFGASIEFGVAVEIGIQDSRLVPPQLALYVTGCAGTTFGVEASVGVNVALQAGGGLDATGGSSTEWFNADVAFAYASGVSVGVTNNEDRIVTFGVGLGAGIGFDVDYGHQCYTRVSPTFSELLNAATCSGEW